MHPTRPRTSLAVCAAVLGVTASAVLLLSSIGSLHPQPGIPTLGFAVVALLLRREFSRDPASTRHLLLISTGLAVLVPVGIVVEVFRSLAGDLLRLDDSISALLTPRMMEAGVSSLVGSPYAVRIAVAVASFSSLVALAIYRPRWSYFVPAVLVPVPLLLYFFVPRVIPPAGRSNLIRLTRALAPSASIDHEKVPTPFPTVEKDGAQSQLILVLLESLGAANLEEHIADHDGCRWPAWISESRFWTSVVTVANVSHLSQPAILTSHAFVRMPGRHIAPSLPQHPLYSFPRYFHEKGYETVMVSSQDERWLDMHKITLDQPWSYARHSPNADANNRRYEDACRTTKILDSDTLAEFETRFSEAANRGPVFGYLNLQNTHFPYVVEHGDLPTLPDYECAYFVDMPAEVLPNAAHRYRQSLFELESRIERLFARFPEATFLLTGDHGEAFLPGNRFGHAKTTDDREVITFALLRGPGQAARRHEEIVSSLDLLPTVIRLVNPRDLEQLPEDLFDGVDLLQTPENTLRERYIVTSSQGLTLTGFKIVQPGRQLTLSSKDVMCNAPVSGDQSPSRRDDGEWCRAATDALTKWLRCHDDFYQGPLGDGRYLNACERLLLPEHRRTERAGPRN